MRKALIGFAIGLLLSFSFAAAAEDLGLTGTITPQQQPPQTLAVTITPNPVDLSSTAGELVVRDVRFENVGNVKAAVSLASSTDVVFSGLKPLGNTGPGAPDFGPDDPAQAERCQLYFVWEPAGWPDNAQDFYLHDDGTTLQALHFWAPFNGQMFTLDPGAYRDTQIRFRSNRYLTAPVDVSGTINFTITAAE
ncbi:MAG: hypothetical protein ACPLRW_13020 [Moorellales bacterium]